MTRRHWKRYTAIGLLALLIVGVTVLSLVLPGRGEPRITAAPAQPMLFPKGFLWGVAIAGQQAESLPASDWTTFEAEVFRDHRFAVGEKIGATPPGDIHGFGRWSEQVRTHKAGFDLRYGQDIDAAAQLGLNAFRVSIEWARLFPRPGMTEPDPEAVAYYHAVFAAMRSRGIEPIVTLFHYVSPAWFFEADAHGKRGWERSDALTLWQTYVDAVANHFIPDVQIWCTLNEPNVYLYDAYVLGTYPPGEKRGDFGGARDVYAALLHAHAQAYRTLHRVAASRGATVSVGLTQNMQIFEPYHRYSPLDRTLAWVVDNVWNWDFLDAIANGRMRLTTTDIDLPIEGLAGTEDYVGVNYYSRNYVRGDWRHPLAPDVGTVAPDLPREERNDLGWPSYPHGFYETLTKVGKRYAKPVMILENGTADSADDDKQRQRYLVAHIREAWLAQRDGVDIRSYIHWSLMDNFEWNEGFDARFGLFAVDYEHDFRRTARPSAALYGEIVHANGLSPTVLKRYLEDTGPAAGASGQ
ncbi:MAG: glycoside hydrolase family 1 protein [Dyella sp.]|nr:glycoside hydrolase family 1 protein [Dyella sp.]